LKYNLSNYQILSLVLYTILKFLVVSTFGFCTISSPAEGEYKDKGSRFMGFLFKIEQIKEVENYLNKLKKQHPKAQHFCYAYRLENDGSVFRSSDDGEPSGSAGKPILNVLLSKNCTYTLAVVVRYFGGTLLGVPGLIKAYKTAVEAAFENTEIVYISLKTCLKLHLPVDKQHEIIRILKAEQLNTYSLDYQERLIISLEIDREKMEKLKTVLKDYYYMELEIL
jgi:uncharacterized YigZ family protein